MATAINGNLETGQVKGNYLSGLNGLRYIAALVLLLGHIGQSDFCDWGTQLSVLPLPDLCAYLFFVLSGVLAGFKAVDTNSVVSFYKKKAKRILPVYYLYLVIAVVAFVVMGRKSEVLNGTLWYYIIPAGNIPFCHHSGILPLVHLWYIGVLTQFYLVFPWLAKLEGKRLLKVSMTICVVWAFVKWLLYLCVGKGTPIYLFFSSSSFDSLFLGVVLGILLRKNDERVRQVANKRWIAILSWLLFLTFGFYCQWIPSPIRIECFAVLSAMLILGQQAEKPFVKLENEIWNWLGNISYEFYVFQILVIILMAKWLPSITYSLPAVLIYVICVAVVTVIAFFVNRLCKLFR